MKVGDTVKVNAGTWRKGKILAVINDPGLSTRYKVGHGEYSGYKEEEFSFPNIKRLQEQSDADFNADFERDMPIGLKATQDALDALLPGEKVTHKWADGILSAYGGSVTLEPVQYEQTTIGAFIERTGFQVTIWKHVQGTRTQPDEWVDAPVGTFPNIGLAVSEFVQAIFKVKAHDYWHAKSDQAYATQVNSDPFL